ncbi:hypothetical protein Taro_029788 [Colocasia esculenta]|uniref:Uncharacterized protein n=1 Tax=Colocasia esculenta TaxID=4460 RepID=A0A843VM93_COLES|nr:hypothetical protein [Colocasia esculenta]
MDRSKSISTVIHLLTCSTPRKMKARKTTVEAFHNGTRFRESIAPTIRCDWGPATFFQGTTTRHGIGLAQDRLRKAKAI